MSNPLKKIGKAIKKGFNAITGGSGRKQAKQAANEARVAAVQASAARATLEEKTKREKARAHKLAIKGLRSRRAASYFKPPEGTTGTHGSPTIG